MEYSQVKKMSFGNCSIPDGYFGNRQTVEMTFLEGRIYFVAPCGYFPSGLPLAVDIHEAVWLLNNHPTARNVEKINIY